jgi:hypothetical protein
LNKFPDTYQKIQGKTYTLFGNSNTSSDYYRIIKEQANIILERFNDLNLVMKAVQSYSRKKSLIEKIAGQAENKTPISFILHLLYEQLSEFTMKVDEHLESLSFIKYWDRRLATTRLQYHLYMLEIELTNRLNKEKFRNSIEKIALLPHCLRDFSVNCKASPDSFDYQCKHCSKNCYQNHVSRFLIDNKILPYIWMGGNLKNKARSLMNGDKMPGILGIACIPELVWGLRKCQKYNIPSIGLPLDANRCARWMGDFHQNSVNLEVLKKLINNPK